MTIGPRDLDVRQGLVSFGEASGQRMKCSWYKKICSWLATSLVGDISGGAMVTARAIAIVSQRLVLV